MSDEQPELKIPPPEPPPPVALDLRTGTEVHPDVVQHHQNWLAGAEYSEPYGEPETPPQEPPPNP
jgi:hypothetical protein